MKFRLIGPFEIFAGEGEAYAPKAPKVTRMLAVLALQPRDTVATGTLIRELWGEDPPPGALRTLQTHVYHARRMLTDARVCPPGEQLLVTRAPGYRLDVGDEDIDVRTFELLVREAQSELDEGALEAASGRIAEALKLWRGPMLSNVPIGSVLACRIARVEELRIRALELRVEIASRRGRFREHLPDLRVLVDEYPLHEWFHGQLIQALHRVGRRAEALQAYQNLFRILKAELGLEPSTELKRLQAEILNSTAGEAGPRPHRQAA